MSTKGEQTRKEQHDQLVAHKRAYGSITSEMEDDAARVQQKATELREAIERLNKRYLSALQRRDAIAAGGEDPGPAPSSPRARVGVMPELPLLLEHPPRKRMNLRRTPAQLEREAKRREKEQEEWRRNARSLPALGGVSPSVPLGTI